MNSQVHLLLALAAQLICSTVGVGLAYAGCDSDEDCRFGRVCIDYVCQEETSSCEKDVDCGVGLICDQYSCVEPNRSDEKTQSDEKVGSSKPVGGAGDFVFPRRASVAVLPFRDHQSDASDDSQYTGAATQAALIAALRRQTDLVVRAVKPTGARSRDGWSRDEALAKAITMDVEYVIYGSCIDFYRVALATKGTGRAAIWLEVVSDQGQVMFRASVRGTGKNELEEAEAILERLASGLVRQWAKAPRKRKRERRRDYGGLPRN